jgi:hypothetical protein
MPTFHEPTDKMQAAFDAVRALDCHRDRLAEVTIAVKAVHASRNKDDEPRGEAIASDGDPVLGKIRIMSLEDRTDGASDVRVLLHGDRWGSLSSGMQRSVIDNCLMRIEVLLEDGRPKLDDIGRPMLRKRKWGYKLCGFTEVDERHGRSSIGVHNMHVFFNEHGQIYMDFIDDEPPVDFLATPIRPKKTPKLTASTGHKRGKLTVNALCTRIEHLESRATILGIYRLEIQENRPRDKVVGALETRVLRGHYLPDFIAVKKGEKATVEPDLAAAVLATSKARPDIDLLDRMVPECCDKQVLGWVLDDEGEEDPREFVLDVVNSRLRELS